MERRSGSTVVCLKWEENSVWRQNNESVLIFHDRFTITAIKYFKKATSHVILHLKAHGKRINKKHCIVVPHINASNTKFYTITESY